MPIVIYQPMIVKWLNKLLFTLKLCIKVAIIKQKLYKYPHQTEKLKLCRLTNRRTFSFTHKTRVLYLIY